MKMLWFDDGWVTTFEVAYPMMKERGLTGIVSLVTGKVGSSWKPPLWPSAHTLMTLEQLKILVDEGWDIASHTVSHPFRFDQLSTEETRYELAESKKWIIENLGVTPDKFVAPRHLINRKQVDVVGEYYSYLRPPGSPSGHIILHRIAKGGFKALLNSLDK